MAARFIVGIDLGTTHTVVAYAPVRDDGDVAPEIRTFAIDQLVSPGEVTAREMLPSVRYHPAEGELREGDTQLPWPSDDFGVTGQIALGLGSRTPGRLVSSAKSWLSHAAVDRTAAILPWGAPSDVRKISPVEASASYLAHVRSAWDQKHPEAPLDRQEVVLTVPASFDEAARALTLEAARIAELPRLRLVEEPQAAFYDWLDRHREDLETALAEVRLAIVVDVGGGTTDLTLIQVELRETGPRLTRIAVGEHLMLGGDNMDLTIARRAEERVAEGAQLGTARFHQLIQQSRTAKERLLAADAPNEAKITVLGSGSKLVGGARSTSVTRDEVRELVLDGFFPEVGPRDVPQKRRGAIVEFGLPYVADPAITRHVAAFLLHHEDLARVALADRAPAHGEAVVPDAVLFNGGVFRGAALADRVLDVIASWRGGDRPSLLENDAPELAVARGAVAYGLARRGVGIRIGGGSPRTYFLALGAEEGEERRGVCILPRGSEEGEEIELGSRTFSLRLGKPVRFPLVTTSSDVKHYSPGEIVAIEGEAYQELPPIAAVLEAKGSEGKDEEVTVRLVTALTEVGTLEMHCVAADDPRRRWALEFQLRGESHAALAAQRVTQLHPRFAEATERVHRIYGKKGIEVKEREVKTLRADLEKVIGNRQDWDTPLLRELFGALFAGMKRRRRSADHERVWFNLTGFSLRPGLGYPLDEWRVKQLWSIYDQGVQFAPEAQNWSEWWTMWRRIAGGLSREAQDRILEDLEWYLHPPTRVPRKRPAGPKMLGYDDMVRLAGALEHASAERKERIGGYLIERLEKHGENAQSWWAIGRLGARVPFYGSAHAVVPKEIAERWLAACLAVDFRKVEQAPFAATLLARKSGDRARDVSPELADRVATRLEAVKAPESWLRMVREVGYLEAADERRIFGESLPPGLRLVD